MTRRGTLVRFAPRSPRTRSWWCVTSGRPSPWSCPTERTRRNLARFLAIRVRQTAVSASVSARWRRFAGRSADRRGSEALPSGRVGRVGRAGRGDNKRTTARIAHSRATRRLWPRGAGWAARWAAGAQEAHTGQRRGVSGEGAKLRRFRTPKMCYNTLTFVSCLCIGAFAHHLHRARASGAVFFVG